MQHIELSEQLQCFRKQNYMVLVFVKDFITNSAHLVGMLHVVVRVHRRNYRKSKIGFSKHAAIVRGIPFYFN